VPTTSHLLKTDKSEGIPSSCGPGPGRKWNSAWDSLSKFVSPKLFQAKNPIKKRGAQKKTHDQREIEREGGRERESEKMKKPSRQAQMCCCVGAAIYLSNIWLISAQKAPKYGFYNKIGYKSAKNVLN
jgi:hypothetical protein